MGFAIDRFWGKEPFWFESQAQETQFALLADYRLSHADPKKEKEKTSSLRVEEARKRRAIFKSEGAQWKN